MAQPKVQRVTTRDPDKGKAILPEVLKLEYAYNSTGSALELDIPASADEPVLLWDVAHIVRTAFAGGTPSIDVGDGSDADAYVDTLSITETSAGNIAYARDNANSEAKAKGEYLTANRKITVTLSASLTAGAGTVLAFIYRTA